MATKKEPKVTAKATANCIDYKDSSLHHDLTEIKVLLGCMLKDIDKLSENINVVTRIEKIRAGMSDE